MGETSGSGSCVEEVPSDHRPGEEDDSHDAYSHGVDDDPEEVHYVRGEDRDHARPVCVQGRGEDCDHARPVCVQGRDVACDHARPVCAPGRDEVFGQDHPVCVPGRGEVFGQDHPIFYHDHEACSCHCPA